MRRLLHKPLTLLTLAGRQGAQRSPDSGSFRVQQVLSHCGPSQCQAGSPGLGHLCAEGRSAETTKKAQVWLQLPCSVLLSPVQMPDRVSSAFSRLLLSWGESLLLLCFALVTAGGRPGTWQALGLLPLPLTREICWYFLSYHGSNEALEAWSRREFLKGQISGIFCQGKGSSGLHSAAQREPGGQGR